MAVGVLLRVRWVLPQAAHAAAGAGTLLHSWTPWCRFRAPHALCSPHPHPPTDSIETVMSAQWYDANISLPGCDKNMPGTIMAMARLNRPSLMIYGGAAAGQGCRVALQQRSRRLLPQKAVRLWTRRSGDQHATWRHGCLPQQRLRRGDAWLRVCGSCAASPCIKVLHLHLHSSCRHHQARLLQAGRQRHPGHCVGLPVVRRLHCRPHRRGPALRHCAQLVPRPWCVFARHSLQRASSALPVRICYCCSCLIQVMQQHTCWSNHSLLPTTPVPLLPLITHHRRLRWHVHRQHDGYCH